MCVVVAMAGVGVLLTAPGLGDSLKDSAPAIHEASTVPVRAFPRMSLGSQRELKYVGSYSADGKFRARPSPATPRAARELPHSMRLATTERRIEDFEHSNHFVAVAQDRSAFAEVRDRLLTLVYGRESVLRTPRHLTTDSRRRLIISDPGGPAVHVLDPGGKNSFRIVAGQGHRLGMPSGTAVDREDNIYVADSDRGVILVYNSEGGFLRSLGVLNGGEGLFHRPTSIAIDRKADRLYVLDSPRLFMLDLNGKVLQRLGTLRSNTGPFENPMDIALTEHELLVIDGAGTRVHMIDLQCNPVRKMNLPHVPMSGDISVGVDSQGNIYASFAGASTIRIYNHDGVLLGSAGYLGTRSGEFDFPTGLWVDANDRVYVADTSNARVQVFQLGSTQP